MLQEKWNLFKRDKYLKVLVLLSKGISRKIYLQLGLWLLFLDDGMRLVTERSQPSAGGIFIGGWHLRDRDKVRSSFVKDANNILQIPLSSGGQYPTDRRVWNQTMQGRFTVRSAYLLRLPVSPSVAQVPRRLARRNLSRRNCGTSKSLPRSDIFCGALIVTILSRPDLN